MKILNKLIRPALLGLIITLSACSTEDPISSTVTNYPLITINGDNILNAPLGEAFTDPGAVATIDEEEVPVNTTYTGRYRGNVYNGTLQTEVADLYIARYSATNPDGFDGVATRQIYVGNTGDLVNSIEGLYRATVVRNGAPAGTQYSDMEYVLIWKNANGTYQISDSIGGYYEYGRAYGVTYINPGGIIVANDISANDFSFPGTQTNISFGGSSQITSMTVNPADNSIDMVTVWQADASTTYTFEIHLEQVQF